MNSIWLNGNQEKFQKSILKNKMKTDTCIIGAGIFGITTAYYLSKAGVDVVLIDKDGIGRKTTGHTTAKITSQHGLIYHYLLDKYGVDFAKAYYLANEESIQEIKNIIEKHRIDCDFEKQDHCMYTKSESEKRKIVEEVRAMKQFTSNIEKVTKTELPFEIELGIKMKNQAQFHPLKYVNGVVNEILKNGGKFFLDTVCYDLKKEKEGYIVNTSNGEIFAENIVLATHYPFINFPGIYFMKMYQSSSYVIGIDPKEEVFSSMYLQVEEPKQSFRVAKDASGKKIILMGGQGHKTGKSVTYEMTYGKLIEDAKTYFPKGEIIYNWSTRDCISLDKIPYIGQFSEFLPNVYVGTGFNKWGMTSSNLAARIITDKILEKENPYEEMFTATRMKPIENKDEVKNMVSQSVKTILVQRIKKSESELGDIKNGEGGVIEYKGKKIGVYKDKDGNIFAVKPVCTHLGCILNWNGADKTWDCPCHGSRFNYTGENLYDPAYKSLEKIDLEED